jgi:hypothetical protein
MRSAEAKGTQEDNCRIDGDTSPEYFEYHFIPLHTSKKGGNF